MGRMKDLDVRLGELAEAQRDAAAAADATAREVPGAVLIAFLRVTVIGGVRFLWRQVRGE